MKKTFISFFLLATIWSLIWGCFAATNTSTSRWDKGTSPSQILDSVAWQANVEYKIQDTALDKVSNTQWAYASQYQIANTLDSIRINIAPYLQWMFYIGLWAATALIVYNGILLMSGAVSGEDYKKVLWRIKNIAIGIAVLTWFALIVRIFISILSSVLN